MNAVNELEEAYNHYKNDDQFNSELTALLDEYAGRPSRLYYASSMTKDLGARKYTSSVKTSITRVPTKSTMFSVRHCSPRKWERRA